jgi:hypothetical protein
MAGRVVVAAAAPRNFPSYVFHFSIEIVGHSGFRSGIVKLPSSANIYDGKEQVLLLRSIFGDPTEAPHFKRRLEMPRENLM